MMNHHKQDGDRAQGITARKYAMNMLTEAGVRFDDDIGNGLLVQLLAELHGVQFVGRPRKNRARKILERYAEDGAAVLEEEARPDSSRNVYVIELDSAVLTDKKFNKANPGYIEGMACLYVGSTCREPEVRYRQHKDGVKASRYANKYGRKLRNDLFEQYNPMRHQEANDKEVSLAQELRDKGYAVWQN